jgi:dTDP-4-dehydrorhamnose reductase
MKTVLLTGANGFVGQYLLNFLVKEYRVIATSRGNSRLDIKSDNLIYETLDLTDKLGIDDICSRYQPTIIIHSGAISKPDDCEKDRDLAYKTNVSSTQFLIENALKYQSYFLFVSTDFVFDGIKGMYNEASTDLKPVNYYGETKLTAEQAVQGSTLDWCIVRTVFVIGKPKAGRQNLLTIVANASNEKKVLKIFNDQIRTPTYVEDLAWAIMEITKKKSKGIYHISGKDRITPYEMAIAVARYLNLDETLIEPVTEDSFEQPARRPLKTGFDISKAVKDLGYQPTSFQMGMKKTFE